ncbi:MAG: hypothetical protein Q9169_005908 [Polycauliona sp. 2 TL-2023]
MVSWSLHVVYLWFLFLLVVAAQYSHPNQTNVGLVYPTLINATTKELETGLEQGLFTSCDLVKAYVARIAEVNSTLRAVTETNPDALSIAAQLDAERANGTTRGPLHGMPILIKGATLPQDSAIAAKLRKAGVIILGKTNLSQWANFRSNNSTNGWSAYGGQTTGAYYPQQDPSGSSSGSGVASSIGLALATLGSETSGSILSPSQLNNLVGIKPSVGLTSRALVVPISERQDTVGPMARSVKDAAYLLQAIAGKDPDDNYTLAQPFENPPDYVGACNYSSLRGKRIGIPRNVIRSRQGNGPVLSAFDSAVGILRRAGATIVDANITEFALDRSRNSNASSIVLDADFISDLPSKYLSRLVTNPNNVQDLVDVRNFTQTFPLEEYPDRDTATWNEALDLGFNNTSPQFWAAYQENLEIGGRQGFLGVLANYSLDALILPTDYSAGLPARVGTPVITVPLGKSPANTTVVYNERGTLVESAPNIPFGLSFIGPAWSETDLIGFAYAYEQRTMVRDQIHTYIVPQFELADIVTARKTSMHKF